MIVGIVLTAGVSGALLQPFSAQRLALVASGVAGAGFLLTIPRGLGRRGPGCGARSRRAEPKPPPARRSVRCSRRSAQTRSPRRFTIFVFVSMLAYSAQELILEPFAGLMFHMSPGQSAQLSGVQHGGVLLGMILVGVLGARFGDAKSLWMRRWTIGGCVGSAAALGGLAAAAVVGPGWPLPPTVFVLGFANGVFAVSAIGSMMGLAGAGAKSGEGVRMGVWGAAQAGAFAIGGFLGAVGVGALRGLFHQPGPAFLLVFSVEAVVFLISALLAGGLQGAKTSTADRSTGRVQQKEHRDGRNRHRNL